MCGLFHSKPKLLPGGRRIILTGAGEEEANGLDHTIPHHNTLRHTALRHATPHHPAPHHATPGLYIEAKEKCNGRTQFVYAGKSRDNAPIIIFYDRCGIWSLVKYANTVGSTSKAWYAADASSQIDKDIIPDPAVIWFVDPSSKDRWFGKAAFTIDPAPKLTILGKDEAVPDAVTQDMEKRGAQYQTQGQ